MVWTEHAQMNIADRRASFEWFSTAAARLETTGPPPLGIHLLMGPTAREKTANMVRNLGEERVVVIEGVAEKRPVTPV